MQAMDGHKHIRYILAIVCLMNPRKVTIGHKISMTYLYFIVSSHYYESQYFFIFYFYMFYLFLFERRCPFMKEKRVHHSKPPAREGGQVREGTSFHLGENQSPEKNTL
jgi:hypothetical protein